ncbi:M23 family metallopeptidase [Streptomyces sp. AJS327]|uniref:M23 family metallopeptidase n=1 Tax=Streptomyces sp. AJS327 TaxID=2545265 RepID=UPI0015DE226E|nr:peptidoglycan DD-metalloendopeptidase family protein [Streptomyces sp. AJS327]
MRTTRFRSTGVRAGAVAVAAVALLATSASGAVAAAPADTARHAASVSAQDGLPDNSWWGVPNGETTAAYNEHFPGYAFGCDGDERHKGLDIGAPTGTTIHAWGEGEVVGTGYDDGGYHRWIQVYFPSIDMSMTLGHLLDGSEKAVGSTFKEGDVLAEVGTEADGINHTHVHYRAAKGNHGAEPVGPCEDMDPFVIWEALGLPV